MNDENSMEICTTGAIEKKLNEIEKLLKTKRFKSGGVDLYKEYGDFNIDNKHVTNKPVQGYNRLVLNPAFRQKQSEWLSAEILKNPAPIHRFLTRFPNGFNDFNLLREKFIDIQTDAYAKKIYLSINKNEKAEDIIKYFENLDEEVKHKLIPVFDLNMSLEQLRISLGWSLPKFDEVVILNSEFKSNRDKWSLILNSSIKYPHKIHIQGIYWSITSNGNVLPIVATLCALCKVKSVSFTSEPIPLYIFAKARSISKTVEEKIRGLLWMDDFNMNYTFKHNDACKCGLDKDSILKLGQRKLTYGCVYHHNLMCLSSRYEDMFKNEIETSRVLHLNSVKEMATQLGIVF